MAGSTPMTRLAALAVLGLPERATAREITQAYRRLAKAAHPDLTGQPDPHNDPRPAPREPGALDAGVRFAALTDAYRALTSTPATPPAEAPASPRPRSRSVTVRFTQPPPPPSTPAPIIAGPVRITPTTTTRRST
jgi:hypothetical protein